MSQSNQLQPPDFWVAMENGNVIGACNPAYLEWFKHDYDSGVTFVPGFFGKQLGADEFEIRMHPSLEVTYTQSYWNGTTSITLKRKSRNSK